MRSLVEGSICFSAYVDIFFHQPVAFIWYSHSPLYCPTQLEAAILESHGIEVPSPSCHSNGEEGEMQEFGDQVSCPLSHQISSK